MKIRLTYSTPGGPQEIAVEEGRVSFGRGSEASVNFADDGLSRLHATVYREGERVWIVDENSTNGTFVNGARVSGPGTPLADGDVIRIGNQTNLRVSVAEDAARSETQAFEPSPKTAPAAGASGPAIGLVPVIVIAVGLFIISITAVVIAFTAFGGSGTEITRTAADDDVDIDRPPDKTPRASATPSTDTTPANSSTADSDVTDPVIAANTGTTIDQPPGKKYSEMTDAERRKYLEVKARRVAQIIGNSSSEAIPPAAIDKIKGFADAYASRARVKPLGGCRFGDNLQATFERASKNAPFIVRAFNEKGIDPRIGLYLAMIESEHCVCLQSPTGPLGMFQFTYATAKLHFEPSDGVIKGAKPPKGDLRCEPEPAARAAASYMKALTGRYGTGPSSVPLAIGSYNSGEGGLSSNLEKALSSGTGLPRDFWTLIAKGDILSKQFQSENFKYVPKFFAAAIIGENPQDFGLSLQPISTYTK